jgi:hypothetical protein
MKRKYWQPVGPSLPSLCQAREGGFVDPARPCVEIRKSLRVTSSVKRGTTIIRAYRHDIAIATSAYIAGVPTYHA